MFDVELTKRLIKLNEDDIFQPLSDEDISKIKKEKEEANKQKEERGEVSEWMITARRELEKEVGVPLLYGDVYGDEYLYMKTFSSDIEGNNGENYWLVTKNEEVAEKLARDKIRDDLNNSPELFEQSWLEQHFDFANAEEMFREIFNDLNYNYAMDIKEEDDDEYPNRLAREMVEWGIISEEEAKDENFDLEDKIDEFVEALTEDAISMGNGGYDYFSLNFGEDEAKKIMFNNGDIDIESAVDDAISVDGIAHFLDSYDGEEIELPSGALAFGE